MSSLRITFLGCGSSGGVPTIGGADGRGDWGACDPGEPRNRRTRSSILVEAAGSRLLVDAGPDLREQLLRCGIARVDALLLTHAHADHIAGLDELRAVNRMTGVALPTFGTAETLATVTGRFNYAFRPAVRGFPRPALEPVEVPAEGEIGIAGLDVRLFRQDHRVMETLGLRIGDFGYSTDLVALPEAGFRALEGVRTWVVGCFARSPHPVHAHVSLAMKWAERVGAERTVLTHMGPDLDWHWMAGNLPLGMEAAYDGMVLTA